MGLGDAPGRISSERWLGFSLKHVSLVALTLQNSVLILILHYSRILPLVGGRRYFTSTAVFLNEFLKLTFCLTFALYDISRTISPSLPATALFSHLISAVFTGDSWKLAIPASLYVLQNSLQYIALGHLDSATFQVTYQLKILPTAIFSVFLLNRKLSVRKWTALGLLMLGVAFVQVPASDAGPRSLKTVHPELSFPWSFESWRSLGHSAAAPLLNRSTALSKRSATYEGIIEDDLLEYPVKNAALGLLAAIGGCTVSAAASVYFEKILKESVVPTSLWVRNVQLAFYSLFPALFIGVIFVDGEEIARHGFFVGYNWVVWMAVILQSMGGILVSLCVKYADNIAKNFATCISILISLCASIWFFEFAVTANFFVGTSIVVFSTWLYNWRDRPRPPPIRIHDYEKTTIDTRSAQESRYAGRSPVTPLKDEGVSTSRPSSPGEHHARIGSSRGYFGAKHRED